MADDGDIWDERLYVVREVQPSGDDGAPATLAYEAVLAPVCGPQSQHLVYPCPEGTFKEGERFTVTMRRYVPPPPHWSGPFDRDGIPGAVWTYVGDRPDRDGPANLGAVSKRHDSNRFLGWDAVLYWPEYLALGVFAEYGGIDMAKLAVERLCVALRGAS